MTEHRDKTDRFNTSDWHSPLHTWEPLRSGWYKCEDCPIDIDAEQFKQLESPVTVRFMRI